MTNVTGREHVRGGVVFELRVNGGVYRVEAAVEQTLAETLRGDLGLTGTKVVCAEGHCGACTVQLDGVTVLSCISRVHTVGGRGASAIEGPRDNPRAEGRLRRAARECV